MHVETALALLEGVSYKPGWSFVGSDATNRFENTIMVRVEYVAPDSDVKYAPNYTVMVEPFARASFPIMVGDCDEPMDFYRKVLNIVNEVESHETREFFAVNGDYFDKPFHPHTHGGMRNWAQAQDRNSDTDPRIFADLRFGVA